MLCEDDWTNVCWVRATVEAADLVLQQQVRRTEHQIHEKCVSSRALRAARDRV